MRKILFFLVVLLLSIPSFGQSVLISDDASHTTPDGSAVFEIYSKSGGLLVPRMLTTERTGIASPANGLIVFDTDLDSYYIHTSSGWQLMQEGFWSYKSTSNVVYLADKNTKVGIGTSAPDGKFEIQADATLADDKPLFEVKNTDGETVFAVYNKGVRIFIDDAVTAGSPGGFAVKGQSNAKTNTDYLWITRDSTRIYIDPTVAAGSPSGFAVKGVSNAKGTDEEYLHITRDSTRVYVNTDNSKAGSPGGFAIKGLSNAKGANDTRFLHLVPDNYFIGHQSGIDITSGLYNSILGYQSARYLTAGNNNTFLGYQAGFSDTSGNNNTFLGYMAGYGNTNASENVAIGKNAGKMNKTGEQNTLIGNNVASESENLGNCNVIIGSNSAINIGFEGNSNVMIGSDVGSLTTTGSNNVFIGDMVGQANSSGSSNIFIGANSGTMNTIGENNIFLGYKSGYNNDEGNYNLFLGYESGHDNTLGSQNTFIGYRAGHSNVSGSSNLFIGHQAGESNTSGQYNTFIGTTAGQNNTTGKNNFFMGYLAGNNNIDKDNNTFIGFEAGFKNTGGENNLFLGPQAGFNNLTGNYNHFIGKHAGYANTSGSDNLFIGDEAGSNNTTGNRNMFIGSLAGTGNKTGNDNMIMGYMSGQLLDAADGNILLGYHTGYNMTKGSQNIIIGYSAGSGLKIGEKNIMIGAQAGEFNEYGENNVFIGNNTGANEMGSDKLYIDCSNTSTPLIWGDFGTRELKINGSLTYNAGSGDVTFPSAQGAAGQVLTASGSGGTYWAANGVLAENGLHLNGSTVEMGGTLTHITSVSQGDYSMIFNQDGIGDFEIQNNGATNFISQISTGNIGIGTATPSSKLSVSINSTSNWVADFTNSGETVNNWGIKIQAGETSGTGDNDMIDFYNGGGTWEGSIRLKDGDLAIFNTSDKRLKNNIADTKIDAIEILNNLNVVDYTFKAVPDVVHTGYIAQEALEIFPSMVTYNEKEDLYGISTTQLIPVLHEAIIDQQQTIKSQQEQINQLIENNKVLQEEINQIKTQLNK